MPFYDRANWPQHHALDQIAEPEREIEPNSKESGVLKVGVTRTRCPYKVFNEETGKYDTCPHTNYWIRYKYPGGWGPIGKVNQETHSSWAARLKLARKSDIVEASQAEWPFREVKRVAGE